MQTMPGSPAERNAISPADARPRRRDGLCARFLRERAGQSMFFTALTIFLLIVMVGVIVGVGETTTTQMRVQNAADAAAYSAAAVQADCLAQIAWLNEGAAVIYGKCLAQTVQNTTTFTQAYLTKAWWNPGPASGSGLNLASADITPPANSPATATPLNPWLNESGRDWYEQIVTIERLIAVLAPILIKNQVYHTAHANYFLDKSSGVEKPLRLAIYPNPGNTDYPAWSFYPDGGSFHDAVLKKDPADAGFAATKGWWITSETDPGYEMKMLHLVIDQPQDNGLFNKWNILHDVPDTKDSSGATKTNLLNVIVDEVVWNPGTPVNAPAGAVVYKGTVYQLADYSLDVNGDKYSIQTYAESAAGEIVMVYIKQPDGKTYLIEKTSGGSYINGVSYTTDAGGNFNVNGKSIPGGMTINGQPVPVSFPAGMDGITFNWPVEFSIKSPSGGQLHVEFGKNTKIRYLFNWHIGWIYADDTEAHVRRLTTRNPDLRWKSLEGEQGRRYHRLFAYEPETNRFKYEIANVGTYTQDMDLRKLGFRALMADGSNGPLPSELKSAGYVPLASIPRQYYDFKNKKYNWVPDDTKWARHQASPWDLFVDSKVLWAAPPRVARDYTEAAKSGAFGGFLDLSTGQFFSYFLNTGGAKVSMNRAFAYSRTATVSPYGSSFNYTALPKEIPAVSAYLQDTGSGAAVLIWTTNALWSYYASFAAENDSKPIPLYGDTVKKNCGFYIAGTYADTATGAAQLVAAVQRIMNNAVRADGKSWTVTASGKTDNPGFVVDLGNASATSGSENLKYYLPYFIYHEGESTDYTLAIWDPYGAATLYKNHPKYPYEPDVGSGIIDLYAKDHENILNPGTAKAPEWSDIQKIVGHRPAVVRRYAYHALGMNTNPTTADFASNGMELDIGTMMLGKLKALPLELTSQVFRNPVVVCAWMPQQIGWLAPLFGRSRDSLTEAERNVGLGNPLHVTTDVRTTNSHKWGSGHFAFSAARVFCRPQAAADYFTNFSYCGSSYQDTTTTAGKQANAGLTYPNFVDSITRLNMSGQRQRWLGSVFNLFEPNWTAALVPFSAALKIEDVVPDSEFIATEDSPAGFLLRQFSIAAANADGGHHHTRDGWMKNAYEKYSAWSYEDQDANRSWTNITAPPMMGEQGGNRVDWSDERMQDLILH